ncbi:uncharacterized protein YLR407W [Monosporozyma servazzii]
MSTATGTKKRGFKSNIQSTLQKWKVAFKKITEETLTNLEENDISNSDNKKIEALFNNDPNSKNTTKTIKRYQFNNNDNKKPITGNSTVTCKDIPHYEIETGLANVSISTPPTTAGAPELKITDEETGSSSIEKLNSGGSIEVKPNGSNNSQSNFDNNSNTTDGQGSEKMTFDEYDVVKECAKLRKKTKGPFCDSGSIWQTRRSLWAEVVTTDEQGTVEHTRDVFKAIPEQYYYRVYKKLVMEDKPLREPLNLEDAMKVINSGWMETKTWDNAAKGVAR